MAHELNKVEILERKVADLESEFRKILYSDKYLFDLDLEMANGRNFVFSIESGTKIGTATNQKLSFYGVTQIVQPAKINAPSGGATVDLQARGAINELRNQQRELGLLAPS